MDISAITRETEKRGVLALSLGLTVVLQCTAHLVSVHSQTLLEGKLEPVSARHTVASPAGVKATWEIGRGKSGWMEQLFEQLWFAQITTRAVSETICADRGVQGNNAGGKGRWTNHSTDTHLQSHSKGQPCASTLALPG